MAIDITSPTFNITLGAPFTLEEVTATLKQGFSNCGFPTVTAESLSSVSKYIVYDFTFDATKTYARARFVLETSISSSTVTVRARLHDTLNYNETTFSPTSNTGANKELGASFTLSTQNALTIYCIPTTEDIFGLVVLENNSFEGFLGMCRPSVKEPWYDEDLFMFTRLVQPTNPTSFWTPYPNPQGTSSSTAIYSKIGIDTFSTRNPVNNLAQVIKAPYLSDYVWGIGGQMSTDIGVCNSTGYFVGDILQVDPGVEEYWLAYPGNNGLVYRMV